MTETNPLAALLIAPLLLAIAVIGMYIGLNVIRNGMRLLNGKRYPRWYELLAGWTFILSSPIMALMGIVGAIQSISNL